ncbi:MAG: hypothetical protein KDD70_10855, partial [Bdellovibrionales bacterium]|nr:hypothetical protein [Bdellovibrionales bacterium]
MKHHLRLDLLLVLCLLPIFAQAQSADRFITPQFDDASIPGVSAGNPPASGSIGCRSLSVSGTNALAPLVSLSSGVTPSNIQLISSRLPYTCKVSLGTGFAAVPFTIGSSDFSMGSSISKTIPYIPVNRLVEAQVLDPNGNVITGTNWIAEVLLDDKSSASSSLPQPEFRATPAINSTGIRQFNVIPGQTYRMILRQGAGANIPGEPGTPGGGQGSSGSTNPTGESNGNVFEDANRNVYYLPTTFTSVNVPFNQPNSTQQVFLRAERADAKIEVTLFDSDGSSAVNGYVDIRARANSSNSNTFPIRFTTQVAANQSIIIPVPSGRTYDVRVGAVVSSGATVQKIQPEPVEVTIPNGSTSTSIVNVALRDPNYTLIVNTSALDQNNSSVSTSSFDFLSCFAYNARGEYSYSQDTSGSAISLNLFVENTSKSETYRVGCFGVQSTSGDSRQFFGETNYNTIKNQTTDILGLTISDQGIAYGSVGQSAPVDRSNELTFPDGMTTLDIPSGALGSSGTATVNIQTATGIRSSESTYPLTAWNITPTLSGSTITDPNDSAELCIPIDEDDVLAQGATTADVSLASYDDTTQQWESVETSIVGTSGNLFACGQVNHYSIFGTILDVAQSLQSTVPTNFRFTLRSKNSKRKKCVAKWTAPDSDFASTLTYILRYSRTKNRKKC